VSIPEDEDPNLVDLFHRILDKNPDARIKMPELRVHPWVTADGQDLLLSTEENTAEMVTHVTEKDYADAIKGIRGVMHVVFSLSTNPHLHLS
jgi:calcium/calmodulin-dependent protein kinase kinase 2